MIAAFAATACSGANATDSAALATASATPAATASSPPSGSTLGLGNGAGGDPGVLMSGLPAGCAREGNPVLVAESGLFELDPRKATVSPLARSCAMPATGQFPVLAVSRDARISTVNDHWSLVRETAPNMCAPAELLIPDAFGTAGYAVGMANVTLGTEDSTMFLAVLPFDDSQSPLGAYRLLERTSDGKVQRRPVFGSNLGYGGLTGSSDGRLFTAFESNYDPVGAAGSPRTGIIFRGFQELDAQAGTARGAPIRYTGEPLERTANRLPIVFWGGALWFILGRPDLTEMGGYKIREMVALRYDFAKQRFETPVVLPNAPRDLQGAAVSTCAPLIDNGPK